MKDKTRVRMPNSEKHAGWSRTADPARVLANCGGRRLGFGRFSCGGLGTPSWPPHSEQYLVSGSQDVHPQYPDTAPDEPFIHQPSYFRHRRLSSLDHTRSASR